MKPDINERIRKAENAKKSKKSEEHERIMKILSARKENEEIAEWKGEMQFDLALTADRIVEMLEDQRDMNIPNTADEDWNQQFCEAIQLLPYARRFAQDCWFANMKGDRK